MRTGLRTRLSVRLKTRRKAGRSGRALLALTCLGTILALTSPGFADPADSLDPQCGSDSSGPLPYKYCIYASSDAKNPDVLWFLHGRSGNEHTWSTSPHFQKVRADWQQEGASSPTVIAVSFGKQWLLTPRQSAAKSGLLEFFEHQVIPSLEARVFPDGLKGRRLLAGESMGGFSSAQLMLAQEVHFDKVALTCPALAWVSPFAPLKDIWGWAEQNHVNLFVAYSIVATARPFYATTAEWEKGSPLYIAQNSRERLGLGAATPPMLVTIGTEDSYGFFPGAQDFMKMATAKSQSEVLWKPVPGPHCSMDEAAVAQFLKAD